MRRYPARVLGNIAVLLSAVVCATAQTWQLDPAFAPSFVNESGATPSLSFVPMADGRLLARGNFTHADGIATAGMARLRTDGTVDPSFALALTTGETLIAAAPLPDGRVLAVRQKYTQGTGYSYDLLRLLANGWIDPAYPPLVVVGTTYLSSLPDGRVLAWGSFAAIGNTPRQNFARFATDGTLDPNYAPSLSARPIYFGTIAATNDGRIYVSCATTDGNSRLVYLFVRLLADGSIDATFHLVPPSNNFHALAVQPDGKIIAVGDMLQTMLPTLSPPGFATVSLGNNLTRLLPSGDRDPDFSPKFTGLATRIASLPDGRIAAQVHGYVPSDPSAPSNSIVITPLPDEPRHVTTLILSAAGAVERDLRAAVGADNDVYLLGALPDGRLLVRYGPPIVVYGSDQVVSVPTPVPVPPVDSTLPTPVQPPPTADTTATATTTVQSAVYLSPRASLARNVLATLKADGSALQLLPASFVTRATGVVARLDRDASGRVIVAGNFTSVDGQPRPGLARFLADGTLDPSFVPPPRPDTTDRTLQIVQPDGRVILRESVLGPAGTDGFHPYTARIVRLQTDGRDDPTFAPASELTADQTRWHASTSDGRLLVSLFEPDSNREENLKLIWLGPDGRRSVTLPTVIGGLPQMVYAAIIAGAEATQTAAPNNPGVYANPFNAVQPLPDGRLWINGVFLRINGTPCRGLVRLLASGALDPSYQPDLSIFNYTPRATLLPDGRAIVSSSYYSMNRYVTVTRRLLVDGTRDPTFPDLPSAFAWWTPDGLPDLNFPSGFIGSVDYGSTTPRAVIAGDGSLWTNTGVRLVPKDVVGISVPPQSQTVVAGRDTYFQVALGTSHPATYQWLCNGSPLAGAQSPLLAFIAVRPAQAGTYQVRVVIDGQTFTSDAATLTVTPNTSRLVSFSARSRVAPGYPQIAGLATSSAAPRPVLLRAIGRGLLRYYLGAPVLPEPVLRLYEGAQVFAEDRSGALSPSIMELAARVGAFPIRDYYLFPGTNFGSALSLALGNGVFTAHTSSGDDNSGIALFEIYDAGEVAPADRFLRAVSVRGRTGAGADTLIAGLVIAGNGPLKLLLRGVGPALAQFGVNGAVADPSFVVYRAGSSAPIASNDDWGGAADVAAAALRTGAFPLPAGSKDAALLLTLEPGAYTLHLAAADAAGGEALAELYTVDP